MLVSHAGAHIKIQASSDSNRISFLKKKRKKKTNILVMFYGVSCFCMYVYTIKVRVYCNKIDCPLQLSVNYWRVGFFNPFDVKR